MALHGTLYGVFHLFQNVNRIFHTLQTVLFQTNNNLAVLCCTVQCSWSLSIFFKMLTELQKQLFQTNNNATNNGALLHRLRSLLHRRRARHCPGRRLLQVATVQLQENAHEHAIKN